MLEAAGKETQKQQAKKKRVEVKEMLPEKTDRGRRNPEERRQQQNENKRAATIVLLSVHPLITEPGLNSKCACDAFTVIVTSLKFTET